MDSINAETKIVNIVISTSLEHKIPLERLIMDLPNTEYNPEQFPGLIMKIREPRASFLIFSSGKVVCTGTKSLDEVELALEKLIEYMATGIPILMIGDKKSEASKLLSKQIYNLTADPKETKIISNFIKLNYKNWVEKREMKNEKDVIKDYTREETTKSLIKIIEKI